MVNNREVLFTNICYDRNSGEHFTQCVCALVNNGDGATVNLTDLEKQAIELAAPPLQGERFFHYTTAAPAIFSNIYVSSSVVSLQNTQ